MPAVTDHATPFPPPGGTGGGIGDTRARPLPREAEREAEAAPPAAVLRAAPLPPIADDRFQPTRAILVGLRESRALAALAADLVDRLSETQGAEADTLRTRLREVVEIGSARDTGGPLASLYAAARRDPASALARVLTAGESGPAFRAALAEAGRELRALDERFVARDFALTGGPSPGLSPAADLSPESPSQPEDIGEDVPALAAPRVGQAPGLDLLV